MKRNVLQEKRSGDGETSPVMKHFAEQLRERRQLQKLSLGELAQRSDVTKATISKIERHETRPSLDVAARLAEGLGVTLSEMLHQTPRARMVIMRAGEHVEAETADGAVLRRVLSPTFGDAEVEFVEFRFAPGAGSGVFPPHRYGTEEYIYVLAGDLLLRIDDQEMVLRKGDSIYYEAQWNHELVNAGREPVIGFAVIKR